jgi:hypothetical protein
MFLIWNQRDLGAGDNAFGAVVAAALAGGLGIWIFKKHPDDAGISYFRISGSLLCWLCYLVMNHHADLCVGSNVTNEDTKEASRKTEVTDNKPMQVEVTDMEKRDVDVEARFREWMKREGKVYPNQEEERKRFEVFKETVKKMDALYEKSSVRYLPESPWADMTYEEIQEMRGYNKRVNYDQYLEEEKAMTRMMKVASFLSNKILFLTFVSFREQSTRPGTTTTCLGYLHMLRSGHSVVYTRTKRSKW